MTLICRLTGRAAWPGHTLMACEVTVTLDVLGRRWWTATPDVTTVKPQAKNFSWSLLLCFPPLLHNCSKCPLDFLPRVFSSHPSGHAGWMGVLHSSLNFYDQTQINWSKWMKPSWVGKALGSRSAKSDGRWWMRWLHVVPSGYHSMFSAWHGGRCCPCSLDVRQSCAPCQPVTGDNGDDTPQVSGECRGNMRRQLIKTNTSYKNAADSANKWQHSYCYASAYLHWQAECQATSWCWRSC